MLNGRVTRMGIAAVYAPKSKYKVFWALILAGARGGRSRLDRSRETRFWG
jgi:hypothetical protein